MYLNLPERYFVHVGVVFDVNEIAYNKNGKVGYHWHRFLKDHFS